MNSRRSGDYGELTGYFKSVSRQRMLSPAEESEVARLWRDTGKQVYADQLVSANLRFVIKIALEYKNYGFPILDLIQEGNMGLVRAVKSFDPDKGYRLISYGVWWIRAYIQEFILKNWSLVKIGTTQLQRRLFNHLQSSQKRIHRLMDAEDETSARESLAKAVGGTIKDVEDMERRMYARDLSIDTPQSDGDASFTLHDRLENGDDTLEEKLEIEQARQLRTGELAKALESLDERERHIVRARHLDDNPLTLRELGDAMGISKERVRQLESRALKSLRNSLVSRGNVSQLMV